MCKDSLKFEFTFKLDTVQLKAVMNFYLNLLFPLAISLSCIKRIRYYYESKICIFTLLLCYIIVYFYYYLALGLYHQVSTDNNIVLCFYNLVETLILLT